MYTHWRSSAGHCKQRAVKRHEKSPPAATVAKSDDQLTVKATNRKSKREHFILFLKINIHKNSSLPTYNISKNSFSMLKILYFCSLAIFFLSYQCTYVHTYIIYNAFYFYLIVVFAVSLNFYLRCFRKIPNEFRARKLCEYYLLWKFCMRVNSYICTYIHMYI